MCRFKFEKDFEVLSLSLCQVKENQSLDDTLRASGNTARNSRVVDLYAARWRKGSEFKQVWITKKMWNLHEAVYECNELKQNDLKITKTHSWAKFEDLTYHTKKKIRQLFSKIVSLGPQKSFVEESPPSLP